MGQRGSNAAGLHQWDEEGNMILLRGGDPQFFGVRTQLERVFHQREENKGKQFFFVSLFSRGCWSSRDNLFIEWVIRLSKGFSKGRAVLDRFS